MSRRLAQHPRYRDMRYLSQSSLRKRQDFSRPRWTYYRQTLSYHKPVLGHGLLLVPFYRFVHSIKA